MNSFVSVKGLKMVFLRLFWKCLTWIMIFHQEFTASVDGRWMVLYFCPNNLQQVSIELMHKTILFLVFPFSGMG